MRLGDLIEVLDRFGVNERLVRTCVFRLSEDGWLVSKRVGRRSVYSLTPNGMRRFQRAYKRVYSEQQRQWDGSWTLVCLPTDPDFRTSREHLERELAWEAKLKGVRPEDVKQLWVDDTPLGRLEQPEDVARVVAFLASEDAEFITGEAVAVNGGAFMD